MALSRVKTWDAGEVLTAADLNAEFSNILDNPISLISPFTGDIDLNGNSLILDADADTLIVADSDDRIDFSIGGTRQIRFGHDSTNSSAFALFDPAAFTAQASTNVARVHVADTNAVTIPSGTTAIAAGLWVDEPNLTATGTITVAASLYVAAAPTEATSNYALWVDAGISRFDGRIDLAKGGDIASASPLVIDSDGSYFDVTGTTGFSSMTVAAGALFMLQFDGALTMTDGASLDLAGSDITTAAGDRAIFFATAADTVIMLAYFREGGTVDPLASDGDGSGLTGIALNRAYGLVPSNNGTDADHDLDFTVGRAWNAAGSAAVDVAALTKQLDAAFAAGDDAGALGDGVSLPTSGTIHLFAIKNDSTGAGDILADTSVTGANVPSGWTVIARVGSWLTDGSDNLIAYTCRQMPGGALRMKTADATSDYSAANPGTSAVTVTLTVVTGIRVEPICTLALQTGTTTAYILYTDGDETPGTPSGTNHDMVAASDAEKLTCFKRLLTNTSAQIKFKLDASAGDVVGRVLTFGWIDYRTE